MAEKDDTIRSEPEFDRRNFLAGLGTGVGTSVVGFPGRTETGSTRTADSGTVQNARPTIGMAVAPDTLNPLQAGSVYSFYIIDRVMLYGTTVHPKTLEFKPWAITDWTLNPDNVGSDSPTLAGVTLRDDLTFHDGEQVTADDLVFTINYFKEQQPTGSLTAAAHQKVSNVEKQNDLTVDIYMSEKDQRWFTNILGFPILPQHIWSEVDDFTQYSPRQAEEGLVGAGAFRLRDFNWQNWYELDIVEDFTIPQADYADWFDDGAPFVDGIRFEVFGSQNALEQAVLNGDVTTGFIAGGFTVNTAVQAEQSDNLTVNQSSESGYNHISYNVRRVPFDDVAFRQFLNKAFDKQWVVAEPYNDIGAVAGDYTVIPALERWRPPGPSDLAQQGSYASEDISSDLLDSEQVQSAQSFPDLSFPGEPGTFDMTEEGINTIRTFLTEHPNATHDYSFGEAQTDITTAPDGQELYVDGSPLAQAHTNNAGEGGQGPLVFSFQPPQEDLYQARYGQQFTGMLKKVGVPVEPKVKTINAQIPTIYVQEDFDMFAMGWGLGVNATHFSSLYSSEGADLEGDSDTQLFNSMGYTGADPLIAEDRSLMDFGERAPVVRQICAEIYRDAPTNITDVAQLLEPTNNQWTGWTSGLGTTIDQDSFLNIRPSQ